MNIISNIVSILAAIFGIWAAWLWLKASRIKIKPSIPTTASISDAHELHTMRNQVDIESIIVASKEVCELNRKAALWTALSIFLTALSSWKYTH
ncbi:MAG TPA: hypothetical protein VFT64_07210 [Rickettsiales bacterium]|nr:hypothetical protein [Rickettsiales bacterium]